ncbi:MAG: hypothetical protein TU35_006555 [Thermoproteus sp. AZ2]|uniref:Uncharacterized protein n=1 Tax=Thermoproteus sp. AZ2 TaxID=1609232 RepID=A0ACC6V1E9_9CREN
MSTLPVEYVRDTRLFREAVEGREIISFEVPFHKFFARKEIVYLSMVLDYDLRKLENMITDMKYGRVVVEKLWALRLDGELFKEKKVLLPDLTSNQVDGSVEEVEGGHVMSIHVNDVKDLVRVAVFDKKSFREVWIYRRAPHPAVIRYAAFI